MRGTPVHLVSSRRGEEGEMMVIVQVGSWRDEDGIEQSRQSKKSKAQ